jgi:hypothetical protein
MYRGHSIRKARLLRDTRPMFEDSMEQALMSVAFVARVVDGVVSQQLMPRRLDPLKTEESSDRVDVEKKEILARGVVAFQGLEDLGRLTHVGNEGEARVLCLQRFEHESRKAVIKAETSARMDCLSYSLKWTPDLEAMDVVQLTEPVGRKTIESQEDSARCDMLKSAEFRRLAMRVGLYQWCVSEQAQRELIEKEGEEAWDECLDAMAPSLPPIPRLLYAQQRGYQQLLEHEAFQRYMLGSEASDPEGHHLAALMQKMTKSVDSKALLLQRQRDRAAEHRLSDLVCGGLCRGPTAHPCVLEGTVP